MHRASSRVRRTAVPIVVGTAAFVGLVLLAPAPGVTALPAGGPPRTVVVIRILICRIFAVCPRAPQPTTTTVVVEPTTTTTTTMDRNTTTTRIIADYWGIEGTVALVVCGGAAPGPCGPPTPRQGQVVIEGWGTITTGPTGGFRQYLAPSVYRVRADFPDQPPGALDCPVREVSTTNPLQPAHVDLVCTLRLP